MPSPNASLLFSLQYFVYHLTHAIYHSIHRQWNNIFGVGGSSGETKIAEGIKDAKTLRFVHYIAFADKSCGLQPPPPPSSPCSATHDIWITCFLFISPITLCQTAFFVQISCFSSNTDPITFVQLGSY